MYGMDKCHWCGKDKHFWMNLCEECQRIAQEVWNKTGSPIKVLDELKKRRVK